MINFDSMKEYDFTNILSEINQKGLFDNYSSEHFLIKALHGKVDYFYKYKDLIKNSRYFLDPLNNAATFLMNFSIKFRDFYDSFTEREMDKFIRDQLAAGKSNYQEQQFFSAMAEVNVINFLMSFGPSRLKKAIYEPKLGANGSNPEARLIYENGITIDVEVKTPGFTNQVKGDEKGILIPTLLLDEKERINFKKQCENRGIKFILPRVGKLKDYINHAGKKFEIPEDSNHINLLFINWTYTEIYNRGYLEPYSLLYNNLNGLLKNKEEALKIGIDEDALRKISAVIVYQDSFDSLIFGDFRYMWNGYNFRMLPNMLMDRELCDIDKIRNSLQMNPPKKRGDDMMPYEFVIEAKYQNEAFYIADFINRRIKRKIKGEDNFTYLTKEYYNRKIKLAKKKKRLLDDFMNNKINY